MSALEIPPHPRRTARLALGVLALIAAAGFAEGFLKQLDIDKPPGSLRAAGAQTAIAEATPAPEPSLQVMETPRPHRAPTPPDLTASLPPAPPTEVASAAASAQSAPATDAAATAPETPAPAPAPNAPAPEAPPT